jgi:hypothetical protein
MRKILLGLALLAACAGAPAQQLYRWVDEKGRTHITDTPPPASARNVQRKSASGGAADAAQTQTPYELAQAIKEFPVVLYTAPSCKEACALSRAHLNKRGVPFREVVVWEPQSNEELKKATGSSEVPALTVGSSVHKGFEPGAYDALLDSARYPRTGILPPRAQAAPKDPEGYVAPGSEAAPKAEPVKPEPEAPKAAGPYAPGAPPQRLTPRQPQQK